MGANLAWAHSFDRSWLNSTRKRIIPEIRVRPVEIWIFLAPVGLHFRIDETRTQVKFGIVDKLAVLALLETIFVDRIRSPIHPVETEKFEVVLNLVHLVLTMTTMICYFRRSSCSLSYHGTENRKYLGNLYEQVTYMFISSQLSSLTTTSIKVSHHLVALIIPC